MLHWNWKFTLNIMYLFWKRIICCCFALCYCLLCLDCCRVKKQTRRIFCNEHENQKQIVIEHSTRITFTQRENSLSFAYWDFCAAFLTFIFLASIGTISKLHQQNIVLSHWALKLINTNSSPVENINGEFGCLWISSW